VINRKFAAEGGLHLHSGGATVFRPADLYLFSESEELKSALELCNIYFVVRRKKITLCPHNIRVQQNEIYGDLLLHDGPFNFQSFPFQTKGGLKIGDKILPVMSACANDEHGSALKVRVTPHDTVIVQSTNSSASANIRWGKIRN
jgi:hypothetical protein